jgi:hypothetical protein
VVEQGRCFVAEEIENFFGGHGNSLYCLAS